MVKVMASASQSAFKGTAVAGKASRASTRSARVSRRTAVMTQAKVGLPGLALATGSAGW